MPGSISDALIVGAGPVGLTMAAALNHHGLKCRIIDKAPSATDKSKALVIWCRTLELLDPLGLTKTFVGTGMKLNGGTLYAGGKPVVHIAMTSDDSPYGFPLMIPQNETERLLTEHLRQRGVTIERSIELLSFEQKPDAVDYVLRHADGKQESARTPWLVGCDGAHSTVRHALGLEFTGAAEPNDWILADIHLHGSVATDEVSIFWHEDGVLAFFPIKPGRFRVIADMGAAPEEGAAREPTLAEVQAKVDERGPGGLTLRDPIWLANFRINERKVSDYRRGRVMLAGDAAHIHSPAGGQGMNTGMQDAFNLAWKLALAHKGLGQAEPLLQTYTSERSAVGDQVLRNADRFTTLATLRNPVSQFLRNHLAPILGSFQFVRDKIRDDWFELSINYRHSPMSIEKWPLLTGGLPAGNRLCDARVQRATDNDTSTVFSLLNGTHYTLLLLSGSQTEEKALNLLKIAGETTAAYPGSISPHLILKSVTGLRNTNLISAALPVWLDVQGQLHQKLHATDPTIVLVRPDGYIGYRCQPADPNALMDYLGRYLIRKA